MATVSTILGDLYVDDQGSDGESIALLWPSLFTDHRMWRYQIPALRAAGLRTLALDPPGHGRSKGPGRRFTMDECAAAGLQVLDAMKVRTPVLVLGTSWGGMVAPRLAMRAPNRIRGMVLTNTTAESATPFERVRSSLLAGMLGISALDAMVGRLIFSLQLAPETRRSRPELGAELSRAVRSSDRRGVINAVRSVLVDRDSDLDALPGVKAPALILSGKNDTILPSIYSRRIAERAPEARHVEVAGAALSFQWRRRKRRTRLSSTSSENYRDLSIPCRLLSIRKVTNESISRWSNWKHRVLARP